MSVISDGCGCLISSLSKSYQLALRIAHGMSLWPSVSGTCLCSARARSSSFASGAAAPADGVIGLSCALMPADTARAAAAASAHRENVEENGLRIGGGLLNMTLSPIVVDTGETDKMSPHDPSAPVPPLDSVDFRR